VAPSRGRGSAAQADATRAGLAAYHTFLADVEGLDHDFGAGWVARMRDVAVPSLVDAARRAAASIQQAHEHGVGQLTETRAVVTVSGSTGSLVDCLDEQNWYVVSDTTGKPDPGVSRGYYTGTASFVLQNGRWYVQTWRPTQNRCTP
jgi:hypothetical protein